MLSGSQLGQVSTSGSVNCDQEGRVLPSDGLSRRAQEGAKRWDCFRPNPGSAGAHYAMPTPSHSLPLHAYDRSWPPTQSSPVPFASPPAHTTRRLRPLSHLWVCGSACLLTALGPIPHLWGEDWPRIEMEAGGALRSWPREPSCGVRWAHNWKVLERRGGSHHSREGWAPSILLSCMTAYLTFGFISVN